MSSCYEQVWLCVCMHVCTVCIIADGYITSDCDADANVLNPHHYTKTAEEAVAAVHSAGTDVREPVMPGHSISSRFD